MHFRQFIAPVTIAALSIAALGEPAPVPLKVGRITIVSTPLFDRAEMAEGSFYRVASLLQVPTRKDLLRRFLLFHEGDPYDPALLSETERNLRVFDFLTSVSVTPAPPHDGVVDVVVVTRDAWTSVINGDFSNEGGKAFYTLDFTQNDFLGNGSQLQLRLEDGIERRTRTIEFQHPAALGPYWNLDALYSKNSDGDQETLQLNRLRDSYTTPWTAGMALDHTLRNERVYGDGAVVARFRQQHREMQAYGTYVLHASQSGASSIAGGIDLIDDTFSTLAARPRDVLPDARHFRFLDAGYETAGFHFVKLNYVDRDLRDQDFNLGWSQSVHLAFSPGAARRSAVWRLKASEEDGHAFTPDSFVTGQLSLTTRVPRQRNAVLSFDTRSVTRFETAYPQALVARVRIDAGAQLDRDVQFFADGQNGLRAYPDFAFEGHRRVILNVEHRIFLGRELRSLFGPGLAAFVDSGQAFDHGFRAGALRTDAGIGLRIGIARFESALIRIDYAWAFGASPIRRAGGVLSISTSQAF